MNNSLYAVALVGPTCSGKSALALKVARHKKVSIIGCDSMQIYRGLDIGTAKPSPEERKQVPHFLIDCLELPQTCSAAQWAESAQAVIAKENASGRIPLIVGGCGLYLRALLDGLAPIPAVEERLRQQLLEELTRHGSEAMHARLRKVDPKSAERLKPRDRQRIIRALSVYEQTGVPISVWQAKRKWRNVQCPVFVLDLPGDLLSRRIERRFLHMMELGWLEEARWLAGLQLPEHHPAPKAVGYRQLIAYLKGKWSLEEAVRHGIAATRQYAKRQRTWFRHQVNQARWGDPEMIEKWLMERLST